MVMSHAEFLKKLADENAANAAQREAQSKRNRQLGRANAANVARATRKASRKSFSRRISNNASSGYASNTSN